MMEPTQRYRQVCADSTQDKQVCTICAKQIRCSAVLQMVSFTIQAKKGDLIHPGASTQACLQGHQSEKKRALQSYTHLILLCFDLKPLLLLNEINPGPAF